jgi:hypothetical protein
MPTWHDIAGIVQSTTIAALQHRILHETAAHNSLAQQQPSN